MKSIFLSYAREDASKAKKVASELERAGHDVWWDRDLGGGSRFAAAIEAELQRRDVVLVLWSQAALQSDWVKDEAAVGRDSGRLLPVLIEAVEPPLGFRQVQGVRLPRSWARRPGKHLAPLLSALDEIRTGSRVAPPPGVGHGKRRYIWAAVAVALLVAAWLGFFYLRDGGGRAEANPKLAVLPFADLSAEQDRAYLSEGIAEAILGKLGREPGLDVVGRTSAWQFRDGAADLKRIRKALGVTHVLEGSAGAAGKVLRVNVRLINARDGTQLWSQQYQRDTSNIFAVQDEIGQSVAQSLRGALAAGARGSRVATPVTGTDTYALYLAGRAKLRERKPAELKEALAIAERVIAADPNYAPGHALKAEAVWLSSDWLYGDIPRARAIRIAEPHARRAIQLAPNASEGYAALGFILFGDQQSEAAARALREAIKRNPARGDLRMWLAFALNDLAHNAEALKQIDEAAALEPLWPQAVGSFAQALCAQRRFDDAATTINRFEARGGTPTAVAVMRSVDAVCRSDFSESLRYARLSSKIGVEPQSVNVALLEYMLGLDDHVSRSTDDQHPFLRLAYTKQYRELAREVRKAGAGFWDESLASEAIFGLAAARDFRTIAGTYQPRRQKQICKLNPEFGLWVVEALRAEGRQAEARPLLDCIKQRLTIQSRGSVRSAEFPAAALAEHWALVHALEGRDAAAFAEMKRAVDLGRRTPYGAGLGFFPGFDRLRSTAQYRQIDERLKRLMAKERAEALRI